MSFLASSCRRLNTKSLGYVFIALILLLTVIATIHSQIAQADTDDYYYSFDETSLEALLSEEFTESTDDDSYGYSEDDGLLASGALDTTDFDSIWTTKEAFSPHADYDDEYEIKGYFRNYTNNGYGSIGFTTQSTNSLSDNLFPSPDTGMGVVFHGGGGEFISDGVSVGSFSLSDGDLGNEWYFMRLYINKGEDEDKYNLRFRIYEVDTEEGEYTDSILDEEVYDISNTGFDSVESLYGYLATNGQRFDRVDRLEIEAAKPPRPPLPAPTSIRSYTNNSTGDVFLGGDFIELGVSKLGSFGTSNNEDIPEGFFGTNERDNIGMSTNPSGFGVNPDLRMDYFMPGSEEERWSVGYKQGEDTHTGSNALLGGGSDISDNSVTDESGDNRLQARSTGTFNEAIETTQVISFERANKFFRNEVTLKNIGGSTAESVRYMRSFDPDNTVDQGGEYDTRNYVPYTHQGGDGKAVVVADTSLNDSDPVYETNGSRSPILFFSDDTRARASTFGFSNSDPYEAEAYDEAPSKGTSVDADQAISIAFDVGNLAPGQSQTVVYYTSLDNRDFEEVLQDIAINSASYNNDKNGDGITDDTQAYVTSETSSITGKVVTLEVSSDCQIESSAVESDKVRGISDPGYNYPNGLLNFTVSCGTPGYITTVKQFYHDVTPAGFAARKFNPNTGIYFDIPDATIEAVNIYGHLTTLLTYQVKDGGSLDVDGIENGTIIDPAGLGVRSVGVPSTGFGGGQSFALGRLVVNN